MDKLTDHRLDNNIHSHTSQLEQAQKLSQNVFSSPQDFLNTIKEHFNEIAPCAADKISKNDFYAYEVFGSNPKAKAAAKIAFDHYDQLYNLNQTHKSTNADSDYIRMKDLNLDLGIITDKGSSALVRSEVTLAREIFAAGALTGLAAFGTALSLEAPPVAFGLGVGTFLGASLTAGLAADAWNAPKKFESISANETQTINSWIARK